ncbi:MAG: carbamoyltransferase C-terminal domain-containing protein [Segetibacter sp.]
MNEQQHKKYYDLLKAFKEKTRAPVLVNTSFNTLGKPTVCMPRDELECFWVSPFDALVSGSFLIEK